MYIYIFTIVVKIHTHEVLFIILTLCKYMIQWLSIQPVLCDKILIAPSRNYTLVSGIPNLLLSPSLVTSVLFFICVSAYCRVSRLSFS